ncbi:hypothetical protein SCLCIDRAFT_415949 [Scleroderma citrinum Foug A]|uniref:Uncharacterized protein n=1 Tax=Scleroderma citrinum Foug A TaxID=1036808 RepID=A0A0C3ALF7_9AGAM|nr:hypothetical protein SCLCIDRAFT_415949 [Scleroderma citrinum Foug A]
MKLALLLLGGRVCRRLTRIPESAQVSRRGETRTIGVGPAGHGSCDDTTTDSEDGHEWSCSEAPHLSAMPDTKMQWPIRLYSGTMGPPVVICRSTV